MRPAQHVRSTPRLPSRARTSTTASTEAADRSACASRGGRRGCRASSARSPGVSRSSSTGVSLGNLHRNAHVVQHPRQTAVSARRPSRSCAARFTPPNRSNAGYCQHQRAVGAAQPVEESADMRGSQQRRAPGPEHHHALQAMPLDQLRHPRAEVERGGIDVRNGRAVRRKPGAVLRGDHDPANAACVQRVDQPQRRRTRGPCYEALRRCRAFRPGQDDRAGSFWVHKHHPLTTKRAGEHAPARSVPSRLLDVRFQHAVVAVLTAI